MLECQKPVLYDIKQLQKGCKKFYAVEAYKHINNWNRILNKHGKIILIYQFTNRAHEQRFKEETKSFNIYYSESRTKLIPSHNVFLFLTTVFFFCMWIRYMRLM